MKKRTPKFKMEFNLRLYFMIIILVIIAITQLLANFITALLGRMFGISFDMPMVLWILILTIILGTVFTTLFSNNYLSPIIRLSKAIQRVAEGDFSTKLEATSSIREIRDSYRNFNTMVSELASTEMLQTDFVSNVSHEFKTPINAIEGYAMLLQGDTNISEEQSECIDKILFNTQRLSSLVGNILLLSKVENQSIQLQKEEFCLDEQIRQAIVLLEPQWSGKEIEFDVEMDPVTYFGSESLLSHVWVNLIGNAVKFDPFGGYVTIRLKNLGEWASFTIQDNGPGIEEDKYLRVFDKFYQADDSHKSEGNGLGLALVKQIVDLSRGSIRVQNMEEGGCMFTVMLPIEKGGI
ncbi:MAG: HAMP domain-containing histidine kinase [Clostridiales bacterium]|nr:HAMP domain-containing histidine kinase [Clostridiales bacterium]